MLRGVSGRAGRAEGDAPARRGPRRRLGLAILVGVLTVLLPAAACRPGPAGAAQTVKLLVEADGVYEVTAAALGAAGFDLAGARPAELALTSGGQPVAFELAGRGRQLSLRFYGQALGPDAHTATNTYWLSAGQAAAAGESLPALIGEIAAAPASGARETGVVTATLVLEEQRQIYAMAQDGQDRWMWQTVFAPAEVSIPVAAPHPAGGAARVRVDLAAVSSAPASPDHHMILKWNGTVVADETWDGLGAHAVSAELPAGSLAAGENTLTLVAPGDTGAEADSVLLDRVELAYPRELVLDGGQLAFSGQADGYVIRAPARLALLWDVTDPLAPAALGGLAARDGVVRLAGRGARRFVAVAEGGFLRPAAIEGVTGPRSRDWPGGADLMIVTVPELRAALAPLVAARQAQGLRVAVLDAGQVYDAFSEGRAGPAGIRALVRHAAAHWTPPAPRYLLLAGDASYDPRGYLAGPEADLVPTQAVRTTFSGWTASDVWYGLDGDGPAAAPLLAVGRFPAQDAAQLSVMVAKTLEYEQAGRLTNALLLADDDGTDFAAEAGAFAAELRGYSSEIVVVQGDGSAARERLLRGLEEGLGLLGYFGHGSVTVWAQEKVFGTGDVPGLTNRGRLPLVFTVTCLSGFFEHPTTPSLGEALLRAGRGGAAAALVPSSAAVLSDQRLLAAGLAQALAELPAGQVRLGDVVRRAQAGLVAADSAGVREILLTFNLLGDPALLLAK